MLSKMLLMLVVHIAATTTVATSVTPLSVRSISYSARVLALRGGCEESGEGSPNGNSDGAGNTAQKNVHRMSMQAFFGVKIPLVLSHRAHHTLAHRMQ